MPFIDFAQAVEKLRGIYEKSTSWEIAAATTATLLLAAYIHKRFFDPLRHIPSPPFCTPCQEFDKLPC